MELMIELIGEIRKRYNVPKEYKSHIVNIGVWDKFKDKKPEYTLCELYTELDIHQEYGCYTQKDFTIVHIEDCGRKIGEYTLLFTKDLKKTFEKYFKEQPIPQEKWIARKGIFKPVHSMLGWRFEEVDIGKDGTPILNNDLNGLLKNEITAFVGNEKIYKQMEIEYKRGILLFGPPGNGKTCFIKTFTRDLNAMTILASSSDYSETEFLRNFLEDKDNDYILKILVFEDIDGMHPEVRSHFLNFLDGLSRMHKVLFIATTNFLDKLDVGIKNRPSRFDTLLKIDCPNNKSRSKLIRRYFPDIRTKELKEAVELSDTFSGAYFKEIFILSKLNHCSVINAIKEIKRRFELLE